MSSKKRFAIVGAGGRSRMYIDGLCRDYPDNNELVGLCDPSFKRMEHWNTHIREAFGLNPVPIYEAGRFDEMVRETRPDEVIVTTVDSVHHQYIIRAMELGCDVVTEKPMTIDDEKVRAIFKTKEKTGRNLRVTFNYRYAPNWTRMRQVVASGRIGRPTLVDFQWRLDTRHGADYFRRWHREKQHSGGLLVHKATHHFDLVNWIIDSYPRRVFADGGLEFYGQDNAAERGEHYPYPRYTGEAQALRDRFALRLDDGGIMQSLYLDAEEESGYIRDRNVFAGEDRWPITAEDTMALTARYRNGALLNYSLIAYCPWEGERMTITGTEGQVEYFGRGAGHIIAGQSDEQLADQQYQGEKHLRLQRMFEPPLEIEIEAAVGGHGGGDAWILNQLFSPEPWHDPDGRAADHIDGAASVLTGVAAEMSIESGAPVDLDDLMPLPEPTHRAPNP